MRVIELGAVTISIINVGDIKLSLLDTLTVPEEERDAAITASLQRPTPYPTQCFHIALPTASILIDACNYSLSFPAASPYFLPDYQPPADLLTQLGQRGVQAEDITHLVITHAHFDHYSGITVERSGQFIPAFPRARHFLGRADWEEPAMLQSLQEPHSKNSHTLGAVHQKGLLELIEGAREIVDGVQIIPAPGESPGHQIVRIHSNGQTLYCLGDLYHDPVEVEHPTWMAPWADADANLGSRLALAQVALDEQALLTAAHIAGYGRLERTITGPRWQTL